MTHNLRDQLLGLGFAPAPKPVPEPQRQPARLHDGARGVPRRPDQGRHASAAERKPAGNADTPSPPHARRNHPGSRAGPGPDARGPRPPHDPSRRAPPAGQPHAGQRQRHAAAGKPSAQHDIDLAKAYAIRAQREKDERIKAEQSRQEEARLRREAKLKLAELIKGQGLNAADADIARHFPYGGKIKRVYVTPEQLKALNAGELGVLQMDGRYILVTGELMTQAAAIFAPAVALKIDPDARAVDDAYAEAQFQVPDDLVW